ncbi:MAG: TetR/AcrR family transcriptional regulator [Actinomycetota bacterium]|nr:TetR/AcrR family transcriptional regulator [Actinomycetota bacterium]
MARYGPGHKQETRQRIIEAAGRRFKQDGIDGSGIATLMGDADLTNGAFYAHFSSKNDLVAAVIGEQLAGQRARFAAQAAEPDGLERIVRGYLSLEHRDDRECGCPSAALLDEIDRCADSTRQVYTDGLLSLVDGIAAQLAPQDRGSARLPVLGVVALMIGTLQLARAVTDRELAEQMLEHGVRTALALLHLERS